MESGAPLEAASIQLSEVLSALSYSLDLTEGQPEGHAIRSALIGMRIARELRLGVADRSALFYALLLKDLGCSSNASKVCALFGADDRTVKHGLKTVNWSSLPESFLYAARHAAPGISPVKRAVRVVSLALKGPRAAKSLFELRCDRGAQISRLLGFPEETALAIRSLDEHWNGKGCPQGLIGEEIPLLARILGLSQTVEVFVTAFGLDAAFDMAEERRGKWFDPRLVSALQGARDDSRFWQALQGQDVEKQLMAVEPEETASIADDERLDRIAEGFAQVIDAKSPWTFRHSAGVAEIAVGVAGILGFAPREIRVLKRAALLHDLGKLGISSLILDKPGKLTDEERREMQRHPELTQKILERVSCFREFADMASAHHERLDGRGYHRGLPAEALQTATRVLTVSDIYEAMAAERPYRPRQPLEKVLDIMRRDVGPGIDPECFEALQVFLDRGGWAPQAKAPGRVEACPVTA